MDSAQTSPSGISKCMMVVVVAALMFVFLPSTLISAPFSAINLTIKNTSHVDTLQVTVYVQGISEAQEKFELVANEDWNHTFLVRAGTYYIMASWVTGPTDYYSQFGDAHQTVTVGWFGSESLFLPLYP